MNHLGSNLCQFCGREVVPKSKEIHEGELCGSCWEVAYRIRKLWSSQPFRTFLNGMEAEAK